MNDKSVLDDKLILNERLPNSMKSIVFQELIKLIYILKSQNNANFKVCFFTAAGTIVGTIARCSDENEMIKYTDDPQQFELDMSSIFDVLSKQYNSDSEKSQEYSDAYMINILDATIYKNGIKAEGQFIGQVILFADQIIGFSLMRQ